MALYPIRRYPVLPETNRLGYDNAVKYIDTAFEGFGGVSHKDRVFYDLTNNNSLSQLVYDTVTYKFPKQIVSTRIHDIILAIWVPHSVSGTIDIFGDPVPIDAIIDTDEVILDQCRTIRESTLSQGPDENIYRRIVPVYPAMMGSACIFFNREIKLDQECQFIIEGLLLSTPFRDKFPSKYSLETMYSSLNET